MRERLRPAYTDGELRGIYPQPHDHTRWHDHILRIALTVQFARELSGPVERAADLSCGDGAVLKALDVKEAYLGDFAPGYPLQGPIDETIKQIPPVNLFVCCETLEHLDDPDTTLKAIRLKASRLVLSTPVDAWGDGNLEHYWAWDRDEVEDMLRAAGFEPSVYLALDLRPSGGHYNFGIWWCR